ncbi:hypothetical protein [Azohydromonas lata]|uniref:Uncharacterized protein n=1 Tax=Azohydromonas lata TaxID=45677 RepID=A0ABU5I9M1_9BURK|nr:hypothetical protein [Azohydromonas lata]MDZ5455617.1 hypothetical protein [Azohydromonas lata]
MHINSSEIPSKNSPPPEYEATMDDLQRRADLGELTLAQARREILQLRKRLGLDAAFLTQWAMRFHG